MKSHGVHHSPSMKLAARNLLSNLEVLVLLRLVDCTFFASPHFTLHFTFRVLSSRRDTVTNKKPLNIHLSIQAKFTLLHWIPLDPCNDPTMNYFALWWRSPYFRNNSNIWRTLLRDVFAESVPQFARTASQRLRELHFSRVIFANLFQSVL